MIPEIDLVDINSDTLLQSYRDAFDPATYRVGRVSDNLTISHTINFARVLLNRGGQDNTSLAEEILSRFLDLQRSSEGPAQGGFPLRTGQMQKVDLNSPVFVLPHLSRLVRECRSRLREDLGARLDASYDLAVRALELRWDEELFVPHRDFTFYTNIFLEYVRNLLVASGVKNDDRLSRKSESQWLRWFNHTAYYGIDEFMSPRYSEIDVDAVSDILSRTASETIRHQCRLVLDLFFYSAHASHHPLIEMPVCGASRDYRQYRDPRGAVSFVGAPGLRGYAAPSEIIREYTDRSFPYEVRGRATSVPFLFKSWQTEHAAIGSSTGGNYFPQMVSCMVAVGRGPTERQFITVPGITSFIDGFVDHRASEAFCVFGRTPTSYTRTQRRTPDADVAKPVGPDGPVSEISKWSGTIGTSRGWEIAAAETGRLVFRAYGHDVHIHPFTVVGDRAVPARLERKPVPQFDDKWGPRLLDLYFFEDGVDWFGFHLALAETGKDVPIPTFAITRHGQVTTYGCDDRFRIRLFAYPTGEFSELYDFDWRTLPLLECPIYTLWPGELAAKSVNA